MRLKLYAVLALSFISLNLGFSSPACAQALKNQLRLTAEEEAFLKSGQVSQGQYLSGAIVGTVGPVIPAYILHSDQDDANLRLQTSLLYVACPTYGVGQLIQGRYTETGWWFTAGEGILSALLYNNYRSNSLTSGFAAYEFLGLIGLRVFEIIDLWTGPHIHNRRWQELMDKKAKTNEVSFYLVPRRENDQLGFEAVLKWQW